MIKIIGIGGAGLNMINAVIDSGFELENAIYIDTSRNGVWAAKTDNFLEIGANMFKGCGSGKNQNGSRVAAELAEGEILEAMKGADTIILLAGLAGGTGGGAIPFISSLALDYVGAKTIAVVTTPANIITPVGVVEGAKSKERAEKALANLRGVLDEENIHVIPTAKGTLSTMYANTDKLVAERVKELLDDAYFNRVPRVFLGGSKVITELADDEKRVIDEYIARGCHILVGDCRGVDTEIQRYLAERGYKRVSIYATDGIARNNIGNFKVINCPSGRTPEGRKHKDYSYYHVKDHRMLTLCDEILMFWDGKSRGSYDNLIDGIAKHKTTKAVLRPFKVILQNM